jgi:hypothetical protein
MAKGQTFQISFLKKAPKTCHWQIAAAERVQITERRSWRIKSG